MIQLFLNLIGINSRWIQLQGIQSCHLTFGRLTFVLLSFRQRRKNPTILKIFIFVFHFFFLSLFRHFCKKSKKIVLKFWSRKLWEFRFRQLYILAAGKQSGQFYEILKNRLSLRSICTLDAISLISQFSTLLFEYYEWSFLMRKRTNCFPHEDSI